MLLVCIYCEAIVHCDLLPEESCAFGPCKSELCLKIWQRLGDGEFVTCDACHEKFQTNPYTGHRSLIASFSGIAKKKLLMINDGLQLRSMGSSLPRVIEVLRFDDCRAVYRDKINQQELRRHFQGFKTQHSDQAKLALKRLIPKKMRF